MEYIFVFIIFSILIYSTFNWPGFTLSYFLFFQKLNNQIFTSLGFEDFRYIFLVILIPILFFRGYSKQRIVNFKKTLLTDSSSLAYLILIFYIFLYSYAINTNYEYSILNSIIFPGTILFILSIYFTTTNIKIYKELVIGYLVFGLLTLAYLFFFNDLSSIVQYERLEVSQAFGIGPIAQGRISALLALTSLLLIDRKKGFFINVFYIFSLTVALFWLAVSGTRTAVVALIICLLILFYFNGKSIKYIFSSALFLSILIFFLYDYGFFQLTVFQRFEEISTLDKLHNTARFSRYVTFINMPLGSFLLGLGPGGWGKYITLDLFSYPHNIILESIIEYGLIGVVTIFIILKNAIKEAHKNRYNSDLFLKIISTWWFFMLINVQISGSYAQNSDFFVLTAILIASKNNNNNRNKRWITK